MTMPIPNYVLVLCHSFVARLEEHVYPRWQSRPTGVISMYKKYVVRLTDQERSKLETLVRRGRPHARKLLYARILLKANADGPDHQWTDERIAEALEVSTATVARERRRFCED